MSATHRCVLGAESGICPRTRASNVTLDGSGRLVDSVKRVATGTHGFASRPPPVGVHPRNPKEAPKLS